MSAAAALLGTLEILLDSESLSEFFTRQELVEVMAQRDQSMLDQLDAYMEETQSDREELVAAQQEVADSKKAIEAAQDELEVLYEENDLLVASLEGQQADAQEQIAANEAEDAELQAQLEALIAERNRQEEEKRQQALQNQQAQNGGSDGGEGATQPSGGTGVEPVTPAAKRLSPILAPAAWGWGALPATLGICTSTVPTTAWISAPATAPPSWQPRRGGSSPPSTTGPGATTCSFGTTRPSPPATPT